MFVPLSLSPKLSSLKITIYLALPILQVDWAQLGGSFLGSLKQLQSDIFEELESSEVSTGMDA